jgi:uncharacterized membrane protein
VSFSPLCTFLWRRKFETTEKCRPQPATSQANAVVLLVSVWGGIAVEELTLLASVAVHVCLQRRRTRESLVADLALVLLLGVGGHLGAELAHHGLGTGGRATSQKTSRPGKSARLIRLGSARAVIGHGRVHRAHGGAVVGVVAA